MRESDRVLLDFRCRSEEKSSDVSADHVSSYYRAVGLKGDGVGFFCAGKANWPGLIG